MQFSVIISNVFLTNPHPQRETEEAVYLLEIYCAKEEKKLFMIFCSRDVAHLGRKPLPTVNHFSSPRALEDMTSTLKLSNTNQKHRCSDIPFNLFERDCQQGSLHHLTEESKTFLWHRFMIDALLHTPKTTQDVENVIAACRLVNEYDPKKPVGLNEQTINKFRLEYQCNEVLSWYTRASFFFDAFNKACRMKNSDAIVLFHSIVKDLDDQLKYEQSEQLHDRTLTLPLTLYRGQPEMSSAELKKISENIGGLISFHSFLSTTSYCPAAASFACGPDPTVAALFQITVNEEEQGGRLQTFASIAKYSKFKDEKEVLFGVSSVFRIVSAEQDDCFWDIKLELTSWEDDPDVRKFINQAHRYLYQNSGKHLPFIAFQQWFSLDSLSYTRPLIELMKFGVVQLSQLFLHQAYQLEGRLKKLIDNVPDLLDLIGKSGTMIVHPNSTIIGPLFDILYDFLYSEKQENQVSFDVSDSISLLSFGGFLLLTGDLMKGIRYFEMLLKNPLINERMKVMIHGVLAASYAQTKQNDRALESCQTALAAFQLSGERTIPGWLPSFLASSHGSIDPADRQTHAMIGRLQPSINEEQSNNMLDEKVRLLYSGHIHFQQRNFRAALNRWEEAAEIESHIPSTAETVYNGAIYIQMAAAYFQLDNSADALKMIVRATRSLASFYPAGHRMFATLNFMRGYYLMHNDKPNEAIVWLKSALENPHFSESPEFCTVVLGLLTTVCIQSGDLDSAKTYGDQALKHGVTEMNAQISELLKSSTRFQNVCPIHGSQWTSARDWQRFAERASAGFTSSPSSYQTTGFKRWDNMDIREAHCCRWSLSSSEEHWTCWLLLPSSAGQNDRERLPINVESLQEDHANGTSKWRSSRLLQPRILEIRWLQSRSFWDDRHITNYSVPSESLTEWRWVRLRLFGQCWVDSDQILRSSNSSRSKFYLQSVRRFSVSQLNRYSHRYSHQAYGTLFQRVASACSLFPLNLSEHGRVGSIGASHHGGPSYRTNGIEVRAVFIGNEIFSVPGGSATVSTPYRRPNRNNHARIPRSGAEVSPSLSRWNLTSLPFDESTRIVVP